MPLVTAAVLPHSPFLLPAIAKANWPLVKNTIDNCDLIAKEFYANKVETLLIFSPHCEKSAEAQIYVGPAEVTGNLKEFGDIDTNIKRRISWPLIQHLVNDGQRKGTTVNLRHDALDYGVVVPTAIMKLPNETKIVAISVNGLAADQTIRLGQLCAGVATESPERIGMIASADLCRRDNIEVINWKPTADERQIANGIEKLSLADYPPITESSCCGLRPIMALLAGLQGKSGVGEVLSFEAPLRIGMLTQSLASCHCEKCRPASHGWTIIMKPALI
jgi:hypothetical protein